MTDTTFYRLFNRILDKVNRLHPLVDLRHYIQGQHPYLLLILLSTSLLLICGTMTYHLANQTSVPDASPLAAMPLTRLPQAFNSPSPRSSFPTRTYSPSPTHRAEDDMTTPTAILVKATAIPKSPTATPMLFIPSTSTPEPSLTPSATSISLLSRPRPTPVSVEPVRHPSSTLAIPTPVSPITIPDKALTILLLGSDQRPDWEDWHTDAIQYVVVYPEVPAVAMLSIPRDLYVYIPGFWRSRINFADMYGETNDYEGGGLGLLNQTLLFNLGITADYYIKVNFDGLIGLVDMLDGIDVPVYCRLEDYWPYPDERGVYPRFTLEPGIHHLDGESALWYARSRKTTSVFSRERRQQQVLEAMWRKAKQINILKTAPTAWQQTRHLYKTDLGLRQMLSLGATAMHLAPSNIRQYNIGREQVVPHVTPYGGNVFLPVWEEIEPIIHNVLAQPAANRAGHAPTQVEIWNGTKNAEWGLLVAERLARYGYLPIIGTPDHHDYEQTQLLYFGNTTKGSGLVGLQEHFDVSADCVIHREDPHKAIKLRLIIGEDYEMCQQP